MNTGPSRKERALELLRANRLHEARALCEEAAHGENNAGAWHLLGVIHGMLGNLDGTEICCRKAIALRPDYAEAHSNLGAALDRLGRPDEAVASLREALRLKPDYPEALASLGDTLSRLGRLEEAIAAYRHLLALDPDAADIHRRLGIALAGNKQYDEAVASYRRAIALRPENAEIHYNLGNALKSLNRLEPAAASYRRALALDPDFAQAHCNLGVVLADGEQFDAAIACYREALARVPDDAVAHNNLGRALYRLGRLDEAVTCYRQAIGLKPDYAEALNNLGIALAVTPARHAEAIECYRRAIAAKPDYAEVYNNLGVALSSRSVEEAAHHYRRAITINPEFSEARFNLSLVSLVTGNFDTGWEEYESRWWCDGKKPRAFPQPPWDGADLKGRTILLHAEQGYGDTLQFIRYAPLVKQRGGRTIVECQPPLARLLRSAPGVDQLIPAGSALPAFDVQLPLLSLPRVFQTRLDSFPANVPYLTPPAEPYTKLDSVLAPYRAKRRIGIAWAGRETHRNDANRSCALVHFVGLAEQLDLALFSLQKGPRSLANADTPTGFPITDLSVHIEDFYDTAAAILRLDLVITVDTSAAHLAGALGRPVWVLLPFVPDWRWLLNREDSPWYPGMRLFRQTSPGDWAGVFKRVTETLTTTARQTIFPLR